jgi:membrane-associated phospholipid phosphatase
LKKKYFKNWHPVVLLLCILAAKMLYLTWLVHETPPTGVKLNTDSPVYEFFSFASSDAIRDFWERADHKTFTLFNGSLKGNRTWAGFWAVANSRAFDLIAGVAMGVIILCYLRRDNKRYAKKGFAFCLVVLVFTVLCSQIIINSICKYKRHSPTKILPEKSVLLSEHFPVVKPKDKSSRSFPGDHAIILFSFAFSFLIIGKFRYGASLLAVAVLFALPRLFSGAHWLTDIKVGTGFILLVTLGLLFATPLYRYLMKYSLIWTERIFGWKIFKNTLGRLIYL